MQIEAPTIERQTNRPGFRGYSSDIVYVHMPEWTEKDEQDVQGIQGDLGYFKNVTWRKLLRRRTLRCRRPPASCACWLPPPSSSSSGIGSWP